MGYISNQIAKVRGITWDGIKTYSSYKYNNMQRHVGYDAGPDFRPYVILGELRNNMTIAQVRAGMLTITDTPNETKKNQNEAEALMIVQRGLKVLGLLTADATKRSWWAGQWHRKPLFGADYGKLVSGECVSWGMYGPRTKAALEALQSCANIDPAKGRSGQSFDADTLAALERTLAAYAKGKDWREGCLPEIPVPVVEAPVVDTEKLELEGQVEANLSAILEAVKKAKTAIANAGCGVDLRKLKAVVFAVKLINETDKLIKEKPKLQASEKKQVWLKKLAGYRGDIETSIVNRSTAISGKQTVQVDAVNSMLSDLQGIIASVRTDVSTITSEGKTDVAEVNAQAESLPSVISARKKISEITSKIEEVRNSGLCINVGPMSERLTKLTQQLDDIISGKVKDLTGAIEKNATILYITVGAVESQSNDLYVFAGKLEEIRKEFAGNGIEAQISLMDIGKLLLMSQSLIRDPAIAARAETIYRETTKKTNIRKDLDTSLEKRMVGQSSIAILRACADVKGLKGVQVRKNGLTMPEVTFEKMRKISRSLAEAQ